MDPVCSVSAEPLDDGATLALPVNLTISADATDPGGSVAGVQFFDLTVSFFGSLDIVPGVLSLEARYLWPVAPTLREWENPDFLFITPKLRLTF